MAVMLLQRVDTLLEPYVPSVKVRCTSCGQECWCDEKTYALFSHLEAVCTVCFLVVEEARR